LVSSAKAREQASESCHTYRVCIDWAFCASIPRLHFLPGGKQVPKNLIEYEKSTEAQQWIRDESAEQEKRYQQIVKEMDDLSEERDVWVEKFFERIQTRGFNVHYNNRRQIPDDEIPTRPDRPFKVVF